MQQHENFYKSPIFRNTGWEVGPGKLVIIISDYQHLKINSGKKVFFLQFIVSIQYNLIYINCSVVVGGGGGFLWCALGTLNLSKVYFQKKMQIILLYIIYDDNVCWYTLRIINQRALHFTHKSFSDLLPIQSL